MPVKVVTQWKCKRCGAEELTEAVRVPTPKGQTYEQGPPPRGWKTDGLVLCPACKEAFDAFMREGARQ